MKKLLPLYFTAVVSVSTACSEEAPVLDQQGNELTPVVLQTDWYAQPEHGGFYQAVAKGFYADEGLQVEIRPGANMNAIPQLVASGRVQFAVGALERMLTQRAMNIPLVSLFPYFQHDPQCVLFHPESGIQTLEDLDGREVMFQTGLIYTDFLQQSMGLELKLIPLDWSLSRFMQDRNFIQQCFLTNEPVMVRNQGLEPGVIPMSESGFDPYRHVYTNEQQIAESPELVQAFTRASLKGWEDFMNNDPSPAFALIMASNPQQTEELMWQIHAEMQRYNLTEGNVEAGEELGQYNRARLRTIIEQLDAMNMLRNPLDMDRSIALDLLPPHLVVDTAPASTEEQ